jgi:hypothetical protein
MNDATSAVAPFMLPGVPHLETDDEMCDIKKIYFLVCFTEWTPTVNNKTALNGHQTLNNKTGQK